MIPKGKLIVIGGAEYKGNPDDENEDKRRKNREFEPYEILGELLPAEGDRHGIEVITTASEVPGEVGEMYIETFKRTGFANVDFMNIGNHSDAANEAFIKRVNKAHAILFSGGDQFRVATILGGTPIMEAICARYYHDKDFILAGTSAGAMAMPTLMLFSGDNNEAMLKGDVKISSGLGLMDHCIVDTHFVKRGRFGRLAQAVVMNPTCIGIGLGEDTALIISKGNEAVCRGSGMVIIIDGKGIGHTNIAYAEENSALCVENFKVHILKKGNGFLLKEREFIPAKDDLKFERSIGDY